MSEKILLFLLLMFLLLSLLIAMNYAIVPFLSILSLLNSLILFFVSLSAPTLEEFDEYFYSAEYEELSDTIPEKYQFSIEKK